MKRNVIIIGAAGRDFHNFNTFFRGNKDYNVVAFTANQIPDIDGSTFAAARMAIISACAVGSFEVSVKLYPQ